jgi:UDP-N-acetylglucosamine--N-acetylmuramyl-(pentapeptide) pyrophosphoryl-undecaprenol N-acetylglucosamine transferase
MRMIVAGGGTGGHLFPGLAVAEMLAAQQVNVLFVGSASGIEATAIPKTQFPFQPLDVRAVRGRGIRGVLNFAFRIPLALARAWRLIGTFQPNVVLGLGGYGSVPIVLAAWVRRVPSVLMEQNVHPGMANRYLAHLACRVCTTFAASARFFPPGKAVQTGNPVRRLESAVRPSADHFTLFIFGGSQGAHRINRAAVDGVAILEEKLDGLRVIHQTGVADEVWVRQRYQELGVVAEVLPFIDDMASAYGRADLVVCRAGATTLAELASVGKPAILVPYPFAADDHQRANAEVLVQAGAAELIFDAALTGEALAARALALARDRASLASMSRAARTLAIPDAAARVADVCRSVAAAGG